MTRSSGRRPLVATFALVAMLLSSAACEETGSGPGGGAGSYPISAKVVLTADEQAGYDALLGALLGADGLSGKLAAFWTVAAIDPAIDVAYAHPSGVTPYEGAPYMSGCGALSVDNAFYCPTDSGIYYDDNLLRGYYRAFGPAGPTVLLAHEWGHHISKLMGYPTFSVQSELQADCLAGMFVGSAFVPDAADAELVGLGMTMYQVGDARYRASGWMNENVHGPASWRAKALLDGSLGDGVYCRDYDDWADRGTEPFETYGWLPAPGIAVTRDGDVVYGTIRDKSAILSTIPSPPAGTTALQHVATGLAYWFGGTASPLGAPYDVSSSYIGGTAAAQGYQYTGPSGEIQHGVFFLHVASTGEAAALSVYEVGPAPGTDPTDPAWDEVVEFMFVVGNGLCSPDGTGAACLVLGSE